MCIRDRSYAVRILGIETSCDDTAAAVVDDTGLVLSSVVSSKDSFHRKYDGIVPEIASRRHTATIIASVDEALLQAGMRIREVDGIAVTYGPGLIGSLLVGVETAKALAYASGKPLILSLIHISEPTRLGMSSYAVFCLK